MEEPTELEIAWAAGLFEGEGCACATTNRGKPHALLCLSMNDREPVERFYQILGGTYCVSFPPSRQAAGHRPLYRWSAQSIADVQRIIELLYSHLSPRRQEAMDRVLTVNVARLKRLGERNRQIKKQ